MTEERSARQRDLLAPYIAAADALITTAAVPGRRAPLLVTREMVEPMRPGSVVVDLAAESGGNVEGAVAGEVVRIGNAAGVGWAQRALADAGAGLAALRPERREPRDADDRARTRRARPSSPPTSPTRSWPARASPTTARSGTSPPATALEGGGPHE